MARTSLAIVVLIGLCATSQADSAPPTDEVLRIQTQLTSVLAELRARDVIGLSRSQSRRRDAALTTLAQYTQRGVFPRRTNDTYEGRRPRFIDDRGVRCAVGELIAASGQLELARAIAAEYEYAYVRDMRSPALAAWANANGFTIDELARIQPRYAAPPTASETRRRLEAAKDDIALLCARKSTPLRKLSIHVFGLSSGVTRVATTNTDRFARCFVSTASDREVGPYDRHPEPYELDMDLVFATPQQMLDRRLAQLAMLSDCTPRPGPLARRATVDVTGDSAGLVIHVATIPSNPRVDTCVIAAMQKWLEDFRSGVWKISAQREIPLESFYAPDRMRENLKQYAGNSATDCYPATDAPAHVKVSLTAHVDDPAFTIVVDSKNSAFAACMTTALEKTFASTFWVSLERPDGTFERYFRIEWDLDITLEIPVETPAARKARADEFQRKFDQHVHGY